jgi:hypothetical protein
MSSIISVLRLYFSYNQFLIYDESVELPGCDWTDKHVAQGFARRDSIISFGTLLEFGYADATLFSGEFQAHRDYQRVIAVPFLVTSGRVIVCGPEELNAQRQRFNFSPGSYRVVGAQRASGGEEETIDLFFEPLREPLPRSTILVADVALNPPATLLETADVVGEA